MPTLPITRSGGPRREKATMADEIEPISDLTVDEEACLCEGFKTSHGPLAAGRLKERLGLFRRRAVAEMVRQGVDRSVAIASVGEFGDGKILDWIITHGPEIIAFVKMIMALFGL